MRGGGGGGGDGGRGGEVIDFVQGRGRVTVVRVEGGHSRGADDR